MFSTEPTELDPRTLRERITVLVIAVDRSIPAHLESSLRAGDELEVRTAATTASMLEQLDSVDCLVVVASDSGASDDADGAFDETETETDADVADAFERIRSHVPDHPIVAVTVADDRNGRRDGAVDAAVRSHRWTVHVPVTADEPTADLERVARRVRTLVERRRLGALSRRALAGLELAQDPIALVDPDGAIEFANRRFAVQFGAERAALPGRSWQACFADETVAHLESTAIPTVADGWRWTGRCTGRRDSGEPFPAHVRLGGLPDGSLVFVVTELEADDGTDSAPDDAAE